MITNSQLPAINVGQPRSSFSSKHLRPPFLVTTSCDQRWPTSNNHFLVITIGHLRLLSLMIVHQLKPSPPNTIFYCNLKLMKTFLAYDKRNKLLPKKAFEKMLSNTYVFYLKELVKGWVGSNAWLIPHVVIWFLRLIHGFGGPLEPPRPKKNYAWRSNFTSLTHHDICLGHVSFSFFFIYWLYSFRPKLLITLVIVPMLGF